MNLLRRIRGVLGTAAVWASCWMILTLPLALWESLPLPEQQRLRFVLRNAVEWGKWGVVSGAGFALLMLLAERHSTLHQLRAWRSALWGALGAQVLPATIYILAPSGYPLSTASPAYLAFACGFSAILGAGSAVGMVRLARGSALTRREEVAGAAAVPPAT